MENKEDFVTMKNGRMMVQKKGRLRPLKENLAVFDGTRVMTDGTVMMTDGTARTMMEGEALTMDGRITDMADMETKQEAS